MALDDHLTQGVYRIQPSEPLRGTMKVPGDKSISHRAVMLGSLAEGTTSISGFLESGDCIATLEAFRQMGVISNKHDDCMEIQGMGMHGLKAPENMLDMGNSGTGTRLLMGILAGQDFTVSLTGDASLRSRPMGRITKPLSQMGAKFTPLQDDSDLPIKIHGGNLKALKYKSPVASAQVKSAILLAGLMAEGLTEIKEPALSRDHTERMLKTFGVTVKCRDLKATVQGGQTLQARDVMIPGDFSSAAFFMVAACIIPDSELLIQDVGVNPTRTGLMDVLQSMGADITLKNQRYYGAEPVADILIKYTPLQGTKVSGETVVRMIDEFPIFAVAAASASSPTVVEQAEELRVKESDRISTIVQELGKMGVELGERADGFTVTGGSKFQGAECFSYGDHRIAMSLSIAALAASGDTTINGTAPISTSFPIFYELLNSISAGKATRIS